MSQPTQLKKQTVTHRYTGETISFLESNKDYLLIEVTLPAGASGPPLHYHDRFTEEFTVMEGELAVTHEGKQQALKPGTSLLVPHSESHTFNNRSDRPVRFQVRLSPGGGFEKSVRIHYGLMDDGLTDAKGNPKNIFFAFYILQLQNTLIAGMPLWLQRPMFAAAVGLGRLTGSFKRLDKYLD
ncbi:cupin domain-containing protein [Paenibacillus sp. strain BS8-2]